MTKRLLRFDASVIFINLIQSKDDALRFPKKNPKTYVYKIKLFGVIHMCLPFI